MSELKPRVLFVSSQPFFEWRGSPIRVGFDVRALAELGYEVDLLTTPIGMYCDLPPEVHLHRIINPFRIASLPIGPSTRKLLFDVFLFFHALWMLIRRRYAVLHGVEDAGFITALLGKLFRIPTVFEKHCDPACYRSGWLRNFVLRMYAFAERITIRLSSSVIATGPGLVEQTRRIQPGKPVHHIFDIPSSLVEADPSEVTSIRADLQKKPDEVLALYVGSFAVYQGIDLMFEGMAKAIGQCASLRFVIVGGNEQQIAARKEWLAGRGIAERVSFLGLIPPDRLPNYLAAADLFLSPRIAGANTPLKILDYLKAGAAIVACDTPANRLILDETTALLTPPTADAFAAGIARLGNDPELRRRLAAQGRDMIRDQYHFTEFKTRIQSCYQGLKPGGDSLRSFFWASVALSRPILTLLEEIYVEIGNAVGFIFRA